MNTLTDKAARLIELREKATQGEWFASVDGLFVDDEFLCVMPLTPENTEIAAYSVNHAAQIARAFLIVVDALEKIISHDKRLPDFSDDPRTLLAYETLKEIEGIK